MIEYFEHTYSIKRFTKITDDYIQALKIYNDTIPYEIKTNTNEITYWLEHKDICFELYIFGLYLDEQLIGFSMTAYLPNTKVVIDDYLSISEPYRVNTLFLNYMGLIQNYYLENNFDVSFYITEISNKYNGDGINRESKLSLKLLCLEDYSRIDTLYIEPSLGFDNDESEFDAYIYFKNTDDITKISKQTYLKLIKSIYMDYYYRWYLPFWGNNSNESNLYKTKLVNLYKRIEIALEDKEIVAAIKNDCDILKKVNSFGERSAGYIPTTKKHNKLFIQSMLTLSILILLVPCVVGIWIKILNFFGVSVDMANSFITAIIPTLITAIGTYLVASKKK